MSPGPSYRPDDEGPQFVPESAINYDEIFRRGGRNLGDEDFTFQKCPRCGQVFLLEYEVGTFYLDHADLTRRAEDSDTCPACQRPWPEYPGNRPLFRNPEYFVTWDELDQSGWAWAVARP